MQIFAKFCKVFGSNKVYNGTYNSRWRKKSLTDTEFVKVKAKSGRPVMITSTANVSKSGEKPMADTQTVILSKLMAYRYRRCNSFWSICLNYEILFVRWILHILIDEKRPLSIC